MRVGKIRVGLKRARGAICTFSPSNADHCLNRSEIFITITHMQNQAPFGGQNVPEWFIAIGDKSIGPMSASEVYERVMAGELTWISYVWKEGMADWQRLADVPTFQAAVPPPPSAKPKAGPPALPAKQIQPKVWFLYFNESQYGPYAEDEVLGMAGMGKINSETFAWKDGMSDWEKISTLGNFSASFSGSMSAGPASAAAEKRLYSRKPVLAKIMIAEGDKLIIGMARDISIGGMQVLSEFVPSKVGSRLKLNVSPPEPTNSIFQPFVAEGLVVRIHDDRRGFSFRFDELSPSARQIIERILQG